jgi:hypothetical protein
MIKINHLAGEIIDTINKKKMNNYQERNCESESPLSCGEGQGVRFWVRSGGLPLRGALGHRAIRYKSGRAQTQHTEFIPSAATGGFPLLSLAEAPTKFICTSWLILFLFISATTHAQKTTQKIIQKIIVGAEQLDLLLPKLKDKRVALLVNHTATIGKIHLVDSLQKRGVDIKKIFAPEHGFRGNADAGEKIIDGLDAKTSLPVISLYGSNKKDSPTTGRCGCGHLRYSRCRCALFHLHQFTALFDGSMCRAK